MKEGLLFLLVGGIIGYFGSIIQHSLELKRTRASELRQEKLKIYSHVLMELSGLFLDIDSFLNELSLPNYRFKFSNRLGRILGPARLIASDKLEMKLRDLYTAEVEWQEYLSKHEGIEVDEKGKKLGDAATKARTDVEQAMRLELKE
jgi:hypothetical protein